MSENGEKRPIQYVPFAVHRTPHCAWGWDLEDRDIEFIKSLDPDHFLFVADARGLLAQEDIESHVALLLRTYYSHALETLFALLGALVQAPDCIAGWFLKYKLFELRAVVDDIQHRRPVLSKLPLQTVTWDTLSEYIHRFNSEDEEKRREIQAQFGALWGRLARDFLDDKLTSEYNSIKHGLRVQQGGFRMAYGPAATDGGPDREKMVSLGGSKYGSTFFIPERLSSKRSFSLHRISVNWDPECMSHGIRLAAMSIRNITSRLKVHYGIDPKEALVQVPDDMDYFESHWRKQPGFGALSCDMDTIVPADAIPELSSSDILDVYDCESDSRDGAAD